MQFYVNALAIQALREHPTHSGVLGTSQLALVRCKALANHGSEH